MAPIARVTAFAKHSINFNRRNLARLTIQLDVACQQWELLVLDLILSGLRILVTNRKGFLKPSHMVALCFLICFRPGYLEHVLLHRCLTNRGGGSQPALLFVNSTGCHSLPFWLPLFPPSPLPLPSSPTSSSSCLFTFLSCLLFNLQISTCTFLKKKAIGGVRGWGWGGDGGEKQKRNSSHKKEHKSFLCFYYVNITP